VHHAPIRVSYSTVTSLVPALLPPANPLRPAPEIILHIGLAAGRDFYALERGAHARGYGAIPDVDGERFTDAEAEHRFPADAFPGRIATGFDTDDVLRRWKAHLGFSGGQGHPHMPAEIRTPPKLLPDVRLSDDAGNFMCGFIYWNSLAHYFSMARDGSGNAERPVVFLHVPDLSASQDKVAEGVRVTVALIRALVESWKEVGFGKGGDEEAVAGGAVAEDTRARTDNNFA
jgi:pyrrolidone-carboxylate peptidase